MSRTTREIHWWHVMLFSTEKYSPLQKVFRLYSQRSLLRKLKPLRVMERRQVHACNSAEQMSVLVSCDDA